MPHTIPLLEDLLILLVASLPITFLFNRFRLPTILGFMFTGVVVGPSGLRLIEDAHAIEVLAEIGVALLMFNVGLEFSIPQLLRMKRLVLLGGGLQVGLTILLAASVAYLLGRPVNQAMFSGFLIALSSTAIVLKTYLDRDETHMPHTRAASGILLFQDLSVVFLIVLVPLLGQGADASLTHILGTIAAALGTVALLLVITKAVVPRLLHSVVKLKSSEMFVVSTVLIVFGTSWLGAHFGLSLALGAFIAGVVLSESEYSHQVLADILPFRDIFNSIFFVSIGMLLSIGTFVSEFGSVILWTLAMMAGKLAVAFAVVKVLGYTTRVALMAALGIAQIGEFSFVLAKVGIGQNLMPEADYQRFIAASVLSIFATPFLIKLAPRAGFLVDSLTLRQGDSPATESESEKEPDLHDHVVIGGYGLNGRNLAQVLGELKVPYIIIEHNAHCVRQARAEGERILYGDVARRKLLHHAGIESASVLVLTISDRHAARRAVSLARSMNVELHIIARTRRINEIIELERLGANEVVPEDLETGIEIFARVMKNFGVEEDVINERIAEIRRQGYQRLFSSSQFNKS